MRDKLKIIWSWTEQKTDFFLILLLSIFLFQWDVAMNKIATYGIDYGAFITGTFTLA